ncbi:MAG: MMPL family transporter [Planctomycetes bacterium]|nr:MMPL family transporter [Planctomycetota bacterium]
MKIGTSLVQYSIKRPQMIIARSVAGAVLIVLLAALPSIWPEIFTFLPAATIDTDPENMLSKDEPIRHFHQQRKEQYSLHDMIVLGIVNKTDPNGVFNVKSLKAINELARYAKELTWDDPEHPGKQEGVIAIDIIAPSMVDNIQPGQLGEVKFDWLMPAVPTTEAEALAVREKAARLPFMQGTLISEDGKALCLYIPISSKHLSYKIADKLKQKIATLHSGDEYHITGLPVAEDTFGVEMFIQMAVSAPMAMALIFLLLLYFFRKLSLILAPMLVAILSVMYTMGALIVSGNTIHIMSSMIPIFIMPIAVLDAIHILSEFYDRYQEHKDQEKAILAVMDTLFVPMLYTSLTTTAGFASLALTPIPPVQVFGIFVAFGVMVAWLLTVTFIPAWIMGINPESLSSFGMQAGHEAEENTILTRLLAKLGHVTFHHSRLVMLGVMIVAAISAYGISRITINDNPVKWFEAKHPIRAADRELNQHFGGTYMAYLEIAPTGSLPDIKTTRQEIEKMFESAPKAAPVLDTLKQLLEETAGKAQTRAALFRKLGEAIDSRLDTASDAQYDAFDAASLMVSAASQKDELFKQPDMLRWTGELQDYLKSMGSSDGGVLVGKSNSLVDLVETINRELHGGEDKYLAIPDSSAGVAQCILQFESSHRPGDLWHFVDRGNAENGTPAYRRLSLWVQLKSGDNRDMAQVVRGVDQYVSTHPAPIAVKPAWFGLTYINVKWQEKMVGGMLQSFIGSFLVVLLMMIVLFRSALWGLLSMIPLTVTIGLIYGFIGLIGKDYDMPVAVLSSLSLGLAVDYAIHFLARSRELVKVHGTWRDTVGPIFGEPSRAIARNVLVVGIGFLPLLAAPLVPYQTVGLFIAAILLSAGVATLVILPALETLLAKLIFKTEKANLTCKCGTCLFFGIVAAALFGISIHQFLSTGLNLTAGLSFGIVLIFCVTCFLLSKRKQCNMEE